MSLTDNQKEFLRFLVKQVRDGQLNGENIFIAWPFYEAVIQCDARDGYSWTIPDIQPAILDLLSDNGYLYCAPSGPDAYRCVLTKKAYGDVDYNFDEPDRSAIHLIPLTEVQHLDPELWERCRISLSAGGNDPKAWDKAVRNATVVLEERLRKLGNTDTIKPDATGKDLVNLIFGAKNPVFGSRIDDKKLKAYRDLYAGMMSVFRNPYAHRFHDPSTEDGGAIIVFIDLLLKMLDDLDRDPE